MKKMFLLLGLTLAMLEGCATYHRMPLDPSAVSRQLQPPSMADIRILVKNIKHPILKPVRFNDRNRLSPDEAGVLAVFVNPELRAVRDQKGLAEAQLFQTGILPNPQISLNLDVSTGGSTSGTVNAFGLGLGRKENHMKRAKWLFIPIAVLCLGGAFYYYSVHEKGQHPIVRDSAPAVPVATVRTAPVKRETIHEVTMAYGTVVPEPGAVRSVSVAFAIRVRQVLVSEGQKVSRGSDLLEIEPSAGTRSTSRMGWWSVRNEPKDRDVCCYEERMPGGPTYTRD
jgi:biotin carboxyl carrier protein